MSIESAVYRYIGMRHGYNLARAYRGNPRPSWAAFFRGENIGHATSEKKARAIVRAHRAAWLESIT